MRVPLPLWGWGTLTRQRRKQHADNNSPFDQTGIA